ncbi:hypothetical protein [Gelidibacter algens]|uniref:hypothetical protein n=1 Tax=Gelidibacter algens TaxID=49280 RepID=UPI0012F9BA45|nr:hypothetical protein [Gelidibacter algens]
MSFVESEYFLAITVKGQNILNANKTNTSNTTNPMQIQTQISILFTIAAYKR